MGKTKNPYPEFIVDECAGIKVRNIKHRIWEKGYKAGRCVKKTGNRKDK